MSLKIKKGQKITALHTNKIVDAICNVSKLNLNSSISKNSTIIDGYNIPVFSLCFYQPDEENIALYFNTQNSPNNIVIYNSEPIKFLQISKVPNDAPDTISGDDSDSMYKEYYNFANKVDINCTADISISLKIVSDTSGCTELPYFYTFATASEITEANNKYEVIKEFPIAIFSEGNIRQVHEGLLIYSDSNEVLTDTSMTTESTDTNTNIKKVQNTIELYTTEVNCTEVSYLQLYNVNNSFCEDGILKRSDVKYGGTDSQKIFPQSLTLRTPIIYYGANVYLDECGNTICETGTHLKYGKAEEYFIINDLSGVECVTFVTPKNIYTYCDLVIGANKCEQYYSMLKFENPCKLTPIYPDDTTVTNITECGDYVLTIPGTYCETTEPGPVKTIFKQFRPTDIKVNDYLCLEKVFNTYTIKGPTISLCHLIDSSLDEKICFDSTNWEVQLKKPLCAGEYLVLCEKIQVLDGPSMSLNYTDKSSYSDGNISDPTVRYCEETHEWEFYIDKQLESGEYISVCEKTGTINGPGMNIAKADNITVNVNYNSNDKQWDWSFAVPQNPGGGGGIEYTAGDYITIENNVIAGPMIQIKSAGSACEEGGNVTGLATYTDGLWTLELNAPESKEYTAGDYIIIDKDDKIIGSKINLDLTNLTGSATHAAATNEWTIKLEAENNEYTAGDYITIDNNTINGAKMAVNAKGIDANFNYSNGTWTLDLCATPSDCVIEYTGSNGITVEDTVIKGPNIEILTGTSTDGGTVTGSANLVGNTWQLSLNAPASKEYTAGSYIIIDANNAINGYGVVKGNWQNVDGRIYESNGCWFIDITVPKQGEVALPGFTGSNGITINTSKDNDGNINSIDVKGPNIEILTGTSTGGGNITGSANLVNDTWQLSLNAPESGSSGIQSINGNTSENIEIQSTSLTVKSSGNTISIENPNVLNSVYSLNNLTNTDVNLTSNTLCISTSGTNINIENPSGSAKWVTNFALVSWNNYSMTFKIDYSDGSSVTNTVSKSGI